MMRIAAVLVPFALQLVAGTADGSEKKGESPFERVDRAVELQMEEQGIVGCALGILRGSKLIYAKGYGLKDIERELPVTEKTVFNWASNSKPVMAVAALQLVQQRKLSLDAPIGDYLKGLPKGMREITVRQILCHQSGIPHYGNGKIVAMEEDVDLASQVDPDQSVKRFIGSPLIFEPGTKYEYSSYAYVLLSAVVQAAGRAPIGKQLRLRIVEPLGLSSFQLDMPLNSESDQEDWTLGYHVIDDEPEAIPDVAHFWKHGAGAYKSDIRDFAKFAIALMDEKLISHKTTETMWTLQKTLDDEPTRVGLGVFVSGEGSNLRISHNGAQEETRTRMVIYPRRQDGMVVMCNTDGADPGRITTAAYAALNKKADEK